MFTGTKRLAASVRIINEHGEAPQLARVLDRVLQSLPENEPFSPEDEARLCEAFSLGADAMSLLLGVCTFIFEQAAYATTAPEKLRSELLAAGVDEAPAELFATVWKGGAAECIRQLKERPALAPLHLAGVDWQLGVATATSTGGRTQEARSTLELSLAPPAGAREGGGAAASVQLGLGQAEALAMLDRLDAVQGQMDQLAA